MSCQECSLFIAINKKRSFQALSSVDNAIIVLLFGYLVALGLTKKSTIYMGVLYDYVKMIAPQDITNFWESKA